MGSTLASSSAIAISTSSCSTFVSSSSREAMSPLANSSSLATFGLSEAVALTDALASSCSISSSVACTLIVPSSLLDLCLGSFSYSEDSSQEGETEPRLRRSWPPPGVLRVEELPSISLVGRRAYTSVRSCAIVERGYNKEFTKQSASSKYRG